MMQYNAHFSERANICNRNLLGKCSYRSLGYQIKSTPCCACWGAMTSNSSSGVEDKMGHREQGRSSRQGDLVASLCVLHNYHLQNGLAICSEGPEGPRLQLARHPR